MPNVPGCKQKLAALKNIGCDRSILTDLIAKSANFIALSAPDELPINDSIPTGDEMAERKNQEKDARPQVNSIKALPLMVQTGKSQMKILRRLCTHLR